MAEKVSSAMPPAVFQQTCSENVCKTEEQKGLNVDPTHTRVYYLKHLSGVSLGVLCMLSSYFSLFYIQSSLHSKGGLGTMALATDCLSQVVASIFVSSHLLTVIGCKWGLVASGICFAVFIAANLWASFATMLPAAAFLGAGLALLRTAMNTLVSDLAVGYARLTGASEVATLSRFFSVFYAITTSASVWANLITGMILSSASLYGDNNNTTSNPVCGAKYCNEDEISLQSANSTLTNSIGNEVPQEEVLHLVIAGLASDGLGITIVLILLSSYDVKREKTSLINSLRATFKTFLSPDLLLLTILTFNTGLALAFLTADVTKAFVTCSIGIQNVGLVITSYGATLCLGTVILGFVASFVPRIVIFLFAGILNMAALLLVLFWTPDPEMPIIYYVIPGIWGIVFAVWTSHLCALYGSIFTDCKQEAFTNHRIFEGTGYGIGFAWSSYLCMSTKIYIVIAVSIVGYLGYFVVERRQQKVEQN